MTELASVPAPRKSAPRLGFGDYLRAARREMRMSQDSFAALIGVRRVTLAAWESGRNLPDELADMATQLQERTGYSRAFFLGWGDSPAPVPAGQVRTDWKSRTGDNDHIRPIRPVSTDIAAAA